jgi:hypothetical protein
MCDGVSIEVPPTSAFHMVKASSKWWERFIEQHRFTSSWPAGIEKVISYGRIFCNWYGGKKVGHQFVETIRITLVFCVELQTGSPNRDRAAVGHAILKRVAAKHSHPGNHINRDLHQSLPVLPPISPP